MEQIILQNWHGIPPILVECCLLVRFYLICQASGQILLWLSLIPCSHSLSLFWYCSISSCSLELAF